MSASRLPGLRPVLLLYGAALLSLLLLLAAEAEAAPHPYPLPAEPSPPPPPGRLGQGGLLTSIGRRIESGVERFRDRVHGHLEHLGSKNAPADPSQKPQQQLQVPQQAQPPQVPQQQQLQVPQQAQQPQVPQQPQLVVSPTVSPHSSVQSLSIGDIIGVAATTTSAGDPDTGSLSTTPDPESTTLEPKNLIRAPSRCDPGAKPDQNGRCREVY